MGQKLKFPPSMYEPSLSGDEPYRVWLFSTLILLRNLPRYKFPSKLSLAEMKHLLNMTKNCLEKSDAIKNSYFFQASDLDGYEKEFLFEHFLYGASFQNATEGQGFLIDESGSFLALLNFKNHIQFHKVDFSSELLKSWSSLSKIEKEFGKQLSFAFSPKFGYLTSDPTECGTALKIEIYLHLPGLIHTNQLKEALLKQKEEDLSAVGIEGSLDEFVGDIVVLKNQYTLGLNEETILHELQTTAFKLISSEQTVRKNLKEKENSEIKDLVGRAYGLLMHSYQLQTKEALSALSLLKLGAELTSIQGIDPNKIDRASFHCRRAHLAHTTGGTITDSNALNAHRATFIHTLLKGAVLV